MAHHLTGPKSCVVFEDVGAGVSNLARRGGYACIGCLQFRGASVVMFFFCPSPLLLPFIEKEADNMRKKTDDVAVVVLAEPIVPRFSHKEAMNKNCSICGKYLLNWQTKKAKRGSKPVGMGWHELRCRVGYHGVLLAMLLTLNYVGVKRRHLKTHFDV